MKKTEQLTVKEALDQGYKYCMNGDAECAYGIEENLDFTTKDWYLLSKEPSPYQIADNEIMDLLCDNIGCQEEVGDDDGELADIVATVDFSEITAAVNNALKKNTYYRSTDIELIP